MLVHKATRGVLDCIWTGRYIRGPDGARLPLERPARLSDVDDPEAWWEIPGAGPLARRVRRYYPFLRPVVDGEGRLADVIPLRQEEGREAAGQAEERRREAGRRGYKNPGRVRPTGLMPFLCTETCNSGRGAP